MQQLSASLGLPRLLEKRVLEWALSCESPDFGWMFGHLTSRVDAPIPSGKFHVISISFNSMSQTGHVSHKDLNMKNNSKLDLD